MAVAFSAGDIIGFSGANFTSDAINLVTRGIPRWCISHVGIVGLHNGRPVLFESTTLDDLPCLIRGEKFQGTQAQELSQRIEGYAGRVWHYPLTAPLYEHEVSRLADFLHAHLGIAYDQIGAMRAGDFGGWSWLESQFNDQNLASIFCSEFCAAAHTYIGRFRTDNVSRWSPNKFLRAERRLEILGRPNRVK